MSDSTTGTDISEMTEMPDLARAGEPVGSGPHHHGVVLGAPGHGPQARPARGPGVILSGAAGAPPSGGAPRACRRTCG